MNNQERASRVLPAGGFGNFDPEVVITSGNGSRVRDDQGREFIDFLIGSGPMVLGHDHPEVMEAIRSQLDSGLTFFANNPEGISLAEVICEAVACADQLRFVSTGGEADMYAIRLARAHTGRDRVLKFEGGYHGMSGEALMSLSPVELRGFPEAEPDSAGIPESVRQSMVIAPFNEIDITRELIRTYASELSCVIIEPLQRIVPPEPGFLEMLREETTRHGIVLIFDEVVTGFRLAYGGAQEKYGVIPDLCALGKIIGGGLPLAAVAGREDIMAHFDKARVGKENFTFQIGTLSGNPLASVAGLKTLEILNRPGAYETLRSNGERIMQAMRENLSRAGIEHQVVGDPVLFDVVFTGKPVRNYRDMLNDDTSLSGPFNRLLRESGILKPAQKIYSSLALTDTDLANTCDAIASAASELKRLRVSAAG